MLLFRYYKTFSFFFPPYRNKRSLRDVLRKLDNVNADTINAIYDQVRQLRNNTRLKSTEYAHDIARDIDLLESILSSTNAILEWLNNLVNDEGGKLNVSQRYISLCFIFK